MRSFTRGRLVGVPAGVIPGVLAVVALTLAACSSSPNSQPASSNDQAAELTSLQTGCEQWLEANPSEGGAADCTSMVHWMSTNAGRYGGPEMMWGDPSRLSSTCQQWIGANPPAGVTASPESWCSSMVAWMTNNIGNWTGRSGWGTWMMHGPRSGCCMGATASTTPPATTPSSTVAPNGSSYGYGDTDHDADCGPGHGDTDHDEDCGEGSGGSGPMGAGHMGGPG